MTELSRTIFAGITYGVMGMGTEGGATPYRITVAANGGWGGTPIAKSGYSVGAMQFDFGQRGKDIDALTGKSYAESFTSAVNEWARQNNTSVLSAQVPKQLSTNGGAIEWMSHSDRMTISAFGDTASGKGWINKHLEKGLITEYETRIRPVLNSAAFEGWSEADILVAAAVLTKAANQSPNRGLVALADLTKKEHSERYTLDDFLVDTKKVEATNTNYHFTKSAEIAKDYVLLRGSNEFGSIIEAAERKIADPAFTPANIGPDSDLWFMRKINSDPKFRSDLKAALAQMDANESSPSVGIAGGGKSKSEIVLVPEDDYVEIQAPKGGTSVIVKAGEAYFYPGGDIEGRRNALKSIETFENRDPNGVGLVSGGTPNVGNWVSNTVYDLIVTTWKDGKEIVVKFFSKDSVEINDSTSTPGIENAQGTPAAPSESPRTLYPSNSKTVHHADEDITVTYSAKADNPDGSILKGDFVTYVQQPDGKTTYFSIRRTVGNETIEKERSVDPVTGEEIFTVSKWVGSGPGSLRFQEQLDARGNHVGDRYIYEGEVYFAHPGGNGQTQWLNERGQTEQEWMKDPANLYGKNAVNGMDRESDLYTRQTVHLAPKDPTSATPTSYRTVEVNGQTYELSANGTLDRKLPGQPAWTESRDSMGGGVIMDAEGTVIAELLPGDRVGMMDDGRIVINDIAGAAVNRIVDESVAGAFVEVGAGPVRPASPEDVGDPSLSINAVNGADHQSDNYLNEIDLPLPELARLFAANPGAFGAGQVGDLDILPFNDNSSFLTNADGDIAGEMTKLSNGWIQVKDISGNSVYVNPEAPRGDARAMLSPDQYRDAQAKDIAGAFGLVNSVIGLRNWDQQTDLGRLNTAVSLYNQIDKLGSALSGGSNLPGDLGGLGAGLGFLSALESGDAGGIIVNGIVLGDVVFKGAVTDAIGSAMGMSAGNVIPVLNVLLALESGNPYSIVASVLYFIPVWGQIAAIIVTIFGALFGGDDDEVPEKPNLPMQEGEAQANWDEAGNVYTSTTQDIEGGGAGAFSWMNHLAKGLQARLAEITDDSGNPLYGLIPARLPSLGFKFDPDGMNYGDVAGHLFLKWFDEAGNEQTRYYDGEGSRGDDTGDTIVSDFMKHAQDAIVPNWEAQTILAHWQDSRASEGLAAANAQAREAAGSGLPQEAADHLSQTLSVLSFDVPATSSATNQAANHTATTSGQQLIDIDGDGYLELTQWVAANQAVLAIDLNGDGSITAGELLDLKGTSSARNNLNWLDANGDQRLDARDPAFTALRVWIDVNQNGNSDGVEAQSLVNAGITAIDFSASPPQIIRADGTSTALTRRHLTGDVLGVAYSATDGGLLEAKELGETVLHAFNTRAFDGEVAHTHGGDVDTDGLNDSQAVLINPQDARLSTTTARTLANRTGSLGFIPLGAGSAQQAQREATAAMVRSANSSLFGVGSGATPLVALALGVGAVQWPTVASAASVGSLTSVGEDGQLAAVRAEPLVQSSVEGVEALRQAQDERGGARGERLDAARVDLTSLQIGHVIADIHPQGSAQDGAAGSAAAINASNQAWSQQIWAQAASNLIAELTSLSGLTGSSPDAEGEPSSALTGAWAGQDTVAVPQDYPQVNGEVIAGTEDIGLRISAALLLANDSTLNAGDPSRPLLSICAVSQPVHGQVALRINEDGATEVVFIPEANYHGQASFAYTVTDQYGLSSVATATLQISSINDAPTTGDETASGNEDATFMFAAADLLANDVDVDSAKDGDALRITRVGLAQHGMVFLDPGGQVRFVPDANYNGPAQFSYWVGDRSEADMAAANNGGVGLESPATMRLTVLPVNDLPVVTGETLASDEDVVMAINPALLLANDTDVDIASNGQTLTISAVSGALHGAVSLLANGTIQFTPEQDYFGAASFVYTASDGNGGYVSGTAVVNLAPVNDVPVVNSELLMGKRDATYTLSQAALLANDTDVETPNGLSIVAVQSMTHGTAVLNPNGSVTFTPTPGYAGRGSFEYVVQDADGAQATGTTEIDFAAINVNPVAVDDSFVGLEDTAFVIQPSQLLVNDSDPDASGLVTLAVDAVRNPSSGTVALQADGSVRFNPSANFSGTATFEYRLNDGEGGQTWATAQLTVQSVNDAPVIEAIWYGDPVYDYYKWVATPGYYIYPEYGPPTYVDPGPHLEQLTSPAEVQGFLNSHGYLMGPVGNVASYSLYNNGQVRPTSFSALDGTGQAYVPPVIDPDGGVGVPGYYVTVPVNAILREHGKIIAYDPDGDSAAITLSVAASPQHGHLWVNAVTPNSTADVAHVGAVLVGQSGAWQYYSHVGDPYHGGDPFSIRITDGGGASTEAVVQASHYGTSPSGGGGGGGGGGGCFPVALDLAGNGIELIRPEDSAIFADINDDGWHERIGWTAASDGVLAFDADQDGRISRSDEVSFVGYKEGALTDLEGLAAFDTDGDGRITANDAQWAQFGVLQDTNANGLQDAGELRTLNELGISAISLQREGTPHMNQGNVVFGTSAVQWADGHTTRASDVMFAGENVALPDVVGEMLAGTLAAAPAPASQEPAVPPMADESARFEQARVNQMAELFNQFVNTATTDGPALGYVGVSNSGVDTLVVAESYTGFNEGQHAATQVFSSLPGGGA